MKRALSNLGASIAITLALSNVLFLQGAAVADTYVFDMTAELAIVPEKKIEEAAKNKSALNQLGKSAESFSKIAEPVWKLPEKSTVTVATGPLGLMIQEKDYTFIYDFRLKKMYTLDNAQKHYFITSLYSDLAYRKAKLTNRIFLSEMMGQMFKGKKQESFFDKFYSEEMYGLCLPGKGSGYKLSKSKTGNEENYSYGGNIVTSFSPGSQGLTGEKRRQFSLYFIYGTYIHPQIRTDMEKLAKVPQKFMFYIDSRPVFKARKTLVLKKVIPGEYVVKVPDGFKRGIEADDPLKDVYKKLVDLGGKPPANLKELTVERFKKSVASENYFDALLTVTEYGLQTGENLGNEIASIKEKMKADPDCQKLVGGLSVPQNEQSQKLALGALDMIDRSKSSKSYLIDIFRANLIIAMMDAGIQDIQTAHEKEPVKAFVSVLVENPFIAGVYHDLGTYLERGDKQSFAWNCFDIARGFYPKHPFMEEIDEKERQLAESLPQFLSGDKSF